MEKSRSWLSNFLIVLLVGLPSLRAEDYYGDIGDGGRDLYDSGGGSPKGDLGGSPSQPSGVAQLGFSGIQQRHDGYVKGETPTIPKTSFSCSAQPYNPGLYADVETQCQVYHVCFEDRQESFLCGPGTNFNQKILACDFWYNFNCQDSPSYYSANSEIGKIPDRTGYRPTGDQSFQGHSQQTRQPSFPSFPSYPQEEQRPIIDEERYVPRPPSPPRITAPPPPPRVQPSQPISRPPPPPPPPVVRQPSPPVRVRPPPPPPPSIQQQVDTDYNFEGDYQRPPSPVVLPPALPATQRPKPVFPPVVSPPRVVHPPAQPSIPIGRPINQPRPVIPTRPRQPEFPPTPDHPNANLKGTPGYRPPYDPPRIPQPSQPIDTGYPTYQPPRQPPTQRPADKGYYPPPPPPIQQQQIETDYVPPPPPPPPIRQQQIEADYVPPPPPPPRQPSRPSDKGYLPPPPPPPPVSPSIVSHQQRPSGPPPSRPSTQVIVPTRPRQPPPPPPPPTPRPVFPPARPPSDHPNANLKGGPGYQPPRPQLPTKFEPTRVKKPSGSTSQTGYQPPPQPPSHPRPHPPSDPGVKGYDPPVVQPPRIKQPTHVVDKSQLPTVVITPPQTQHPVFPPPRQQQPDHPNANIKGGPGYQPPLSPHPQRPQLPSTSVSQVKRPDPSVSQQQQHHHPQPPSHPRQPEKGYQPPPPPPPSRVKQPIQPISRPLPPAIPPSRVKQPSQPIEEKAVLPVVLPPSRPSQQVFPPSRPQHIDHPNANLKGGPGYQPPRPQLPATHAPRIPQASQQRVKQPPAHPPSPPASSSIHQQSRDKGYLPQSQPQRPSYPQGGSEHTSVIQQQVYEPQRPSHIDHPDSNLKGGSGYQPQRRPQPAQQQITRAKTPQQDYNTGANYKRGPDTYPKPEFQQPNYPNRPYHPPVATPSRSSQTTKQGSPSQVRQSQKTKPQPPATPTGHRGQSSIKRQQSEYPYQEVPGHQPPHQRQVFPQRDNPDHPNASIKGSTAYRPPPPADYQSAASDIHTQQVVDSSDSAQPEPEPEPKSASSLMGDDGKE